MSEQVKIEVGSVWRLNANPIVVRMVTAIIDFDCGEHYDLGFFDGESQNREWLIKHYTLYRHSDGTLADDLVAKPISLPNANTASARDEHFFESGRKVGSRQVSIDNYMEDAPPLDRQLSTARHLNKTKDDQIKHLEKEIAMYLERMANLWKALREESDAHYIYFAFDYFNEDGTAKRIK